MESLFTHLLAETRAVHDATPPLREFAKWPEDLLFERPVPREIPALPTIKAMAGKGALYAALAAVCPLASWVQTYSEAEVGRHFLALWPYRAVRPGRNFPDAGLPRLYRLLGAGTVLPDARP